MIQFLYQCSNVLYSLIESDFIMQKVHMPATVSSLMISAAPQPTHEQARLPCISYLTLLATKDALL